MEPTEQKLQQTCPRGARFRGKLLKLAFGAALALMSGGTLLIALYTFFVRGIH